MPKKVKKNKPCPCGSGKKYKDCCLVKEQTISGEVVQSSTIAQSFQRNLSYIWAPAVLFIAIALYEIIAANRVHNFPQYAFTVHNGVLFALSKACFFMAAILLLIFPLRHSAVRHLDRLGEAPLKTHALWLGLTFIGILSWLVFIRYCQYRSYLIPSDSSDAISAAHNLLFYGTYRWRLMGINVLAFHFHFFEAIFSPVLLFGNHPFALMFMQHLFLCSIPITFYLLVYQKTKSSYFGFLGILLTISNPFYYELLTSNLHNSALAAFPALAMLFFYWKRWWLFGIFVLLSITNTEQGCFVVIGAGLYAIFALGWRQKRSWLIGLSITALGIIIFFAEMKLVYYMRQLEVGWDLDNWKMFGHLAPKDLTRLDIPKYMISHPFETLGTLFSSKYTFYPIFRVLFFMGFMCVFAPAAMLPFLVTMVPHVMSNPGNAMPLIAHMPINYTDFGLHHGSYMFGPLVFASALGASALYNKLKAQNRHSWVLLWVLLVAGFGFRYSHRSLHPNWRPTWFDSFPRITKQIPKNARLWADEWMCPPLAARKWIRLIQWGPLRPMGYQLLFKPDYVLLDRRFPMNARSPYRDEMLTFFAENNYTKIAVDGDIMLLKSPNPSANPLETPEWIQLPEPDQEKASYYGRYLMTPL